MRQELPAGVEIQQYADQPRVVAEYDDGALMKIAAAESLAALAETRRTTRVELLLATIDSPAEVDVKAVGRLLLAQPAADLRVQRAALFKLALNNVAESRIYAWAALAVFTTASHGWLKGYRADHLTVGIREAYHYGLGVALPTGPNELGFAMDGDK